MAHAVITTGGREGMRQFLLGHAMAAAIWAASASAQPVTQRPPVIDMHVHSAATSPQAAPAVMDTLNIRYVFLSASTADIRAWVGVDPKRYLPALTLPCEGGRSVVV